MIRSHSSTTLYPSCSICINGESIALPDKTITFPGYENSIQTCADVATLGASLSNSSRICRAIQSIGTICGCPQEEDSCQLCSNGRNLEYGWRKLPFLAHYFGDLIPTCEILEATLRSQRNQSKLCTT
jgi:hypothetical protein